MENTYKQLSYLDLGFSSYLTRPPMAGSPLGDALERSIRNSSIVDSAIRTRLIQDSAVTNEKIQSLSIDKLTAGTITVQASIGSANVKIDGANNRIIVNDGTNDRILIGYLAGKF